MANGINIDGLGREELAQLLAPEGDAPGEKK